MADELAILIRAQNLTQQAFDQARKDIANLGEQTGKTNNLIGGLKTGLGALGVAFSAAAVVGFAKDVLDTAGNIKDMSQALGISTDAVQDFTAKAEENGATLDDVGAAINKLNVEAGNGAKGFEKLGLNLQAIQALSPEARFRAVADALEKIEDPATRAALGQELLGKGYKNVAAAIDDGIGSSRAWNKMSKETIETLDTLGDALVSVGIKAKNFAGTVLAAAVNSPRDLFRRMNQDLDDLGISIEEVTAKAPGIPKAFDGLGRTQIAINATDKELAEANKTLDAQRKVLDEAAQKAKQHADAIGRIRDELTGKGAIRAALDMVEALRGSLPIQALDETAKKKINAAMVEAIAAYQRFGQVVPPAINQAYVLTAQLVPVTEGLTNVIKDLGHEAEIAIPTLAELPKPVALTAKELESLGVKSSLTMSDLIPAAAKKSVDHLGLLSQALSQLSQVAGDTFGGIAQGIGTVISSIQTARQGISSFKDGLNDWKVGSTWDGILGMTTGILGITSAAITAVKAIAGLFDRNKGRDLVVDFAANLGGFDALHNALLQGGDAGEALWIKLTQGVGKNNPDQAKQVIAEVQAYLDKLGKTVVEPQINPQVNWPEDTPDTGSLPPEEPPSGGYASGTRNLDFVDFRRASRTVLHGTEAVIPQSGVGRFARQVASVLSNPASSGGGGGHLTIQAADLPKFLKGEIVSVTRNEAKRGGLKTRAASGRSY